MIKSELLPAHILSPEDDRALLHYHLAAIETAHAHILRVLLHADLVRGQLRRFWCLGCSSCFFLSHLREGPGRMLIECRHWRRLHQLSLLLMLAGIHDSDGCLSLARQLLLLTILLPICVVVLNVRLR